MEFWRTDEIAPVVLIILFELMVLGLIKGVFHAIVQASMEQMEAYGKLVSRVAQTLTNSGTRM